MAETSEAPRLDKWLWFARFAKTRSQAQTLCASGHVRVNGEAVRRGHRMVRLGDSIEVLLGTVRREVTVAAFGSRRGPAPEAQALYVEITPPRRLGPAEDRPAAARPRGSGRPTKRERRLTDALIDPFIE
ncbi:RNA-binding S4 domain-containing protein [Oleispirillum naphthae]|uniref:RNA-binding S4 domain-containing protein n=1 Tax=Oleispirillum naphthae TaxID=2838853 RepID=UPI00308221B6